MRSSTPFLRLGLFTKSPELVVVANFQIAVVTRIKKGRVGRDSNGVDAATILRTA